MTFKSFIEFVQKNTMYVMGIVLVVFAVMGYNTLVTKVSNAESTVERMRDGFNVQFNQNAQRVELLGQRLGNTETYIAGTRYLTDPGFFSRLFSSNAREQKRLYDSILTVIPQAVREEFAKNHDKPTEIGVTNVVIDSVLVEVKVGNSVKFARGSLLFVPDSNLYRLTLYKDIIEITDVRGVLQSDGFLMTAVTARSKLTGQPLEVTSMRNFINWETSHWDLRPEAFLLLGPTWKYDGTRAPDVQAGMQWIKYKSGDWEWTALRGDITPVGVSLRTGLTYKF